MAYSLKVSIPLIYTDTNRLSGRDWRTRHARFERVKKMVAIAIQKKPKAPLKHFKIAITRKGPGFLDWDNLVSSMKPYIDGLTLSKVIHDDSWTYIKHIDMGQEKSEENVIEIEVKETKLETNRLRGE